MRRSNQERLHASHREPRHRTVIAISNGAEVGINVRNGFFGEHFFEGGESVRHGCRTSRRSRARPGCESVVHYHDHRNSFLFDEHFVENELRAPGMHPFGLVFSGSVLQPGARQVAPGRLRQIRS
jgi:hypothetical protein